MKIAYVFAAALAVLTGCAEIQSHESSVVDQRTANQRTAAEAINRQVASTAKPNPAVEKVNGDWIGGRRVVTENRTEGALPANLDTAISVQDVTGTEMATVFLAAERITALSGVTVRVMPDAAPASSSTATSVAPAAALMPPGQAQMYPGTGFSGVAYKGKLSGLLDSVAAKFGISWKYENKQIVFYKFVTRVFSLNLMAGTTAYKSNIGKTASGGTFSAGANIEVESKMTAWTSLLDGVKQMLSSEGKAALNEGTGTLVVTDVKEVVERVGKFVNSENNTMTRQVYLQFKVINVVTNNDKEYGIDWNLVYTKLTDLVPDVVLGYSSPATLVGTAAGGLGLQVVSAPDENKWSGSSALLQALASVGDISVVRDTTVTTTNRQPVPFAITKQTTYLASTTPGTSTTAGATSGAPGLTPGTVTTGFILKVLPVVTDDNRIIMRFGLDSSLLKKIGTISTGSGATLQSIQTPEVDSVQFDQSAVVRSGDSIVLAGFTEDSANRERATLSEGAPIGIGGSYKGGKSNTTTVVIVTPLVVSNAQAAGI